MTSRTILIDLRAAQFNGDRGIPAYAQSLALELVSGRKDHRWLLWHDPRMPLPSRAGELAAHATWHTAPDLARSTTIDAVLTGCFFLPDHRHGADSLMPDWLEARRPRRLGIVYDLVPLLFRERYLQRPRAERQYAECLATLQRSDFLFAISKATRRDAIRHAAIDPARIDCIYGDIDHAKRAIIAAPNAASADIPARYGLTRRYGACVGGDDWRKNLDAAVRAFALLHKRQPDCQFAIVCKLSSDRVASLRRLATSLGLPDDSLVCTGFVPDDHLVALVRHANVLVYPSLYEGLGLPVLEAHACDTPVVGSNTSSVAELVLPELSFDPENPVAMADAMDGAMMNDDLREASRAFGRRLLAEDLGWDRAAEAVMARIDPPARTRACSVPAWPRVAVVAAMPTARTGTAAVTRDYLQSPAWQTTFYDANPGPEVACQDGLLPSTRLLPAEVFPATAIRDRHDVAVFVLGNSAHHVKVLDALVRSRGSRQRRLAYLHECALESLFRVWLGDHGVACHARAIAAAVDTLPDWITRALAAKPTLHHWLRFLAVQGELDGVIVNSAACRDLIRAALGPLAEAWTIDVAFNPVVSSIATVVAPPPPDQPLHIGTFGLAGDMKQLDLVAQAAAILARTRPVHLVIAGWEARRYCRRAGLTRARNVEVIDSPDDAALRQAMLDVHVAVQLRARTFGESSGVVNQLLALGRPLVVTDAGSFSELSDGLATRVSPDCTATDLAEAIRARATTPIDTSDLAAFIESHAPARFSARMLEILEGTAAVEVAGASVAA